MTWSWRPALSAIEYEGAFWPQRHGELPAYEQSGEPPPGQPADRIGRDANGELVYATLADYRGGHVARLGRERRGDVADSLVLGQGRREATRAEWRSGCLSTVERAWQHPRPGRIEWSRENYLWTGERLHEITVIRRRLEHEQWIDVSRRTFDMTYAASGELERIVDRGNRTVFQAPQLSDSELSLRLEDFEHRLADYLHRLALRTAPRDMPAYAYLLVYEGGWNPPSALLPDPLWGPEDLRASLAQDPEKALKVWDPYEFDSLLPDERWQDAPDLVRDSSLLAWELEARGHRYERVRELMIRVSMLLNNRDWSGLSTTSDFVVVPSDEQAAQLPENLRMAVPTHRLRQLDQAGWVPSIEP